MKASTLIDDAKRKLNLISDYGIAKRLKVRNGHIVGYRNGSRHMPLDVVYRLAIILEIDPAQVVAELEAERAKNPETASFWRSFLSRAALLIVTAACTLAWSFSSGHMAAQDAAFSGLRRPRYCA